MNKLYNLNILSQFSHLIMPDSLQPRVCCTPGFPVHNRVLFLKKKIHVIWGIILWECLYISASHPFFTSLSAKGGFLDFFSPNYSIPWNFNITDLYHIYFLYYIYVCVLYRKKVNFLSLPTKNHFSCFLRSLLRFHTLFPILW